MRTQDTIQAAATAILTNKSRSLLTMLGIIIGVASVVLMVSVGRTFQVYIEDQVNSFGSNTMDVYPTGFEKFGGNLDSITVEDYEAVKKLSTVESVVPVILVSDPVKYGKEEVTPMVMGATELIFGNYGLTLDRGRLPDASDIDGGKSVAVLAYQTALDLFGNKDPLGQKIQVGNSSFTVVGTLEGLGSLLLQDLDTPVFIPYTTARVISGQKHLTFMTLKTVGDPDVAHADITALLRQRHRIDNPENDPDKDDFIARSAESITEIINSVTLGLTVFLALIAAISLLVGGIGIMNIMLVSVTERTREIGLRKALGAKREDILRQFLYESVALTFSGGMIGLLIGAFFGWLLTQIAAKLLGELSFVLSTPAVLLALAMAIGTGLVFGLYPARQAASLSPMEALRYE